MDNLSSEKDCAPSSDGIEDILSPSKTSEEPDGVEDACQDDSSGSISEDEEGEVETKEVIPEKELTESISNSPKILNDSENDHELLLKNLGNTEHSNFLTKASKKSHSLSSNLLNSKDIESLEGELDFEEEIHEKEETSKEDLDDDENKMAEEEEFIKEDKEKADLEEKSAEEGEDDGEVSDDDDLEEGEVKDTSNRKAQPRPVCRFFCKGQCTWGSSCRFIHPGFNDKGNYNMFAPSKPSLSPASMGGLPPGMGPMAMGAHRPMPGPMRGPGFLPPLPPPLPPVIDPPPVESSWERGLRHAKELMKKASRRKEQEPDFEEKRLNMSIDESDRAPLDYDKENEYYGRSPYKRSGDTYNYYSRYEDVATPAAAAPETFDNNEREAREYWRAGRYENFEVRWTRQSQEHKERPEKERNRTYRPSYDREKQDRSRVRDKERWRDERFSEVQTPRSRADEWRDPWRRSKTPKGRRSHSRGRSRNTYSSGSSRSISGRTSRSSYSSHSSSSRSSYYSSRRSYSRSRSRSRFKSRSRSPPTPLKSATNKVVPRKRYPSPAPSPPRIIRNRSSSLDRRKPPVSPPRTTTTKGLPTKRKPELPSRKSRSRSYSHSDSSHSPSRSHSRRNERVRESLDKGTTKKGSSKERKSLVSSSSRSHSLSHSQSHSRSRSYSRSLSMSSVSSASSSISHSSSGSSRPDHATFSSIPRKENSKKTVQKTTSKPTVPTQIKETQERGKDKEYDKNRDVKEYNRDKKVDSLDIIADKPVEEILKPYNQPPPLQPSKASKEPVKPVGHKQPIKLTLLNKALPKTNPKRENDLTKRVFERDETPRNLNKSATVPAPPVAVKRPASPTSSSKAPAPAKRPASSRREELLKQLKAVEDAIARKRAKFS